jgi:hypothetical protein
MPSTCRGYLISSKRETVRKAPDRKCLLERNSPNTERDLGILALVEKRWNRAANFSAEAVEQDPGDAKTYYLIA